LAICDRGPKSKIQDPKSKIAPLSPSSRLRGDRDHHAAVDILAPPSAKSAKRRGHPARRRSSTGSGRPSKLNNTTSDLSGPLKNDEYTTATRMYSRRSRCFPAGLPSRPLAARALWTSRRFSQEGHMPRTWCLLLGGLTIEAPPAVPGPGRGGPGHLKVDTDWSMIPAGRNGPNSLDTSGPDKAFQRVSRRAGHLSGGPRARQDGAVQRHQAALRPMTQSFPSSWISFPMRCPSCLRARRRPRRVPPQLSQGTYTIVTISTTHPIRVRRMSQYDLHQIIGYTGSNSAAARKRDPHRLEPWPPFMA